MKNKILLMTIIAVMGILLTNTAKADNVFLLTGSIDSENIFSLNEPTFIDGDYIKNNSVGTNYSITFYSEDTELNQSYFDMHLIDLNEDTIKYFAFDALIPINSKRAVFRNSTDTIYEHYFSDNAPEISDVIVEHIGEYYSVSWVASDIDGDNLNYDIYYLILLIIDH